VAHYNVLILFQHLPGKTDENQKRSLRIAGVQTEILNTVSSEFGEMLITTRRHTGILSW
jgi:hypothetical protein